jgi:hypothetical protein
MTGDNSPEHFQMPLYTDASGVLLLAFKVAAIDTNEVDVTFPIPFPNACDAVVPMITLGGSPTQAFWVTDVTRLGFTLHFTDVSTFVTFYLAVGR